MELIDINGKKMHVLNLEAQISHTTIPPEISKLKNLQGLYLRNNQLTTLPNLPNDFIA